MRLSRRSRRYPRRVRGWELERPPRWGVVMLAALVGINVALFAVLGVSPEPEDSYGGSRTAAEAAALPTPRQPGAPTGAPEAEEPLPAPVLAVYGDGYAAGNESGGLGAAGWPALVAERTQMQLQLHAASQSGYASVGTGTTDRKSVV